MKEYLVRFSNSYGSIDFIFQCEDVTIAYFSCIGMFCESAFDNIKIAEITDC